MFNQHGSPKEALARLCIVVAYLRSSFRRVAVCASIVTTEYSLSHKRGFVRDQVDFLHHPIALGSHPVKLEQETIDFGLSLSDFFIEESLFAARR